jgi:hypothetical protein
VGTVPAKRVGKFLPPTPNYSRLNILGKFGDHFLLINIGNKIYEINKRNFLSIWPINKSGANKFIHNPKHALGSPLPFSELLIQLLPFWADICILQRFEIGLLKLIYCSKLTLEDILIPTFSQPNQIV